MTTANGQTPAPFMQDAPAVISTLGTDAHQGLTREQAAHNLNQYGPNAFTKPEPESMLSRIVKTAADPMLIMLMIAAAITLGINITRTMAGGHADILECVGIFFAIALSVTITVVMEGRSAKAFEALNDINNDTTVTVVRDGEVTLVSQRGITIGDALQIGTGDKLPADARLIESNDLTADESALTGESVPSAKAADAVFADPKTPVADRTNMLYSGCFVSAGNGRAVVTAVGDDTEFGKIARELRAADTGMTPLQEKLAKLGKVIAVVGSIVAALVFMLQVARFVASGTAEQQSTILFTLFVVFQLFNAFNSRELGNASLFANLLRNKVMIGVFALMFALQVLVVQFGGAMFRTVPLPIDLWLKIIAVGFGVVVLQEAIKAVKRAAATIRARRTANESDSQQPHQPITLDLVD